MFCLELFFIDSIVGIGPYCCVICISRLTGADIGNLYGLPKVGIFEGAVSVFTSRHDTICLYVYP